MPSNWVSSHSLASQIQGGLTSVMTPRLVNNLRVSYSYLNNDLYPVTTKECPVPVTCIGLDVAQIQIFDAPLFRIGHHNTVPKEIFPRTYQLVDNLTRQSGSHRVIAGGEWEHLTLDSFHAFYEPALITLWGPTDLLGSPALRPLYDALPASLKEPAARAPDTGRDSSTPTAQFHHRDR